MFQINDQVSSHLSSNIAAGAKTWEASSNYR